MLSGKFSERPIRLLTDNDLFPDLLQTYHIRAIGSSAFYRYGVILSRKDVKNTRTAGDEWLYMLQPNFDAGILFFDDHKKTWIARGTKHFAKFEDMVTCINKLNSGVHPR